MNYAKGAVYGKFIEEKVTLVLNSTREDKIVNKLTVLLVD